MAEKEERIVLLVTKPKGECPCQIDKDYCKETCWVKGKCSLGMTRQEAIERIEKVLEESWWSSKTFRQISEDVLDALLSEWK